MADGHMRSRALAIPALAVASAGLSLALLEHLLRPGTSFPVPPYAVIGLCWAGVCLLAVIRGRRTATRLVWLNLAAVILGLVGLETYFWIDAPTPVRYADDFVVPHDVLGYAPRPSAATGARRSYRGVSVFDATYSIDERGLRVGPRPDSARPGCVWFFGGSFTFGEGVNDDETLPWQVGAATGWRAVNFGFPGYGPHQMLAALESGLAGRTGGCAPDVVVYQTGIMHVERVAGRVSWDQEGPRYVLDADGRLRRAGRFSDAFLPRLLRLPHLDLSHIYRRLLIGRLARSGRGVALYLAVVRQAAGLLRRTYPDSALHAVFWDVFSSPYTDDLVAGLQEAGFSVDRVSEILPDYPDHPDRYRIPHDGHPNARAHGDIAGFLADRVIGRPAPLSRETTGRR